MTISGPVEIVAIEIYRSAFVAPVVFQVRTPCGVIAIWTGHRAAPPSGKAKPAR